MSMTPEEQRTLAIECFAREVDEWGWDSDILAFRPDELANYTAAVEANILEKCAAICDAHTVDDVLTGVKIAQSCAFMIRNLK